VFYSDQSTLLSPLDATIASAKLHFRVTRLFGVSNVYSGVNSNLQKIQENIMIYHLQRELIWAMNKDLLLELPCYDQYCLKLV
jgi:hypothetical protein